MLTICPKLGDAKTLTGLAKLTMLNALKNSPRNSILTRSVTGKYLMTEMSTFRWFGPRRIFRPLSPKPPAAVAGAAAKQDMLKYSPSRDSTLPPRAGSHPGTESASA